MSTVLSILFLKIHLLFRFSGALRKMPQVFRPLHYRNCTPQSNPQHRSQQSKAKRRFSNAMLSSSMNVAKNLGFVPWLQSMLQGFQKLLKYLAQITQYYITYAVPTKCLQRRTSNSWWPRALYFTMISWIDVPVQLSNAQVLFPEKFN